MKFGIHNPSWLFGPDRAEIFEAVKAKALWAEGHGFTWFSVMDHLIQIGNVGAPDEPSWKAGRFCQRLPRSQVASVSPRLLRQSAIAIPPIWPRSPPVSI
jgi:hypothetical protein